MLRAISYSKRPIFQIFFWIKKDVITTEYWIGIKLVMWSYMYRFIADGRFSFLFEPTPRSGHPDSRGSTSSSRFTAADAVKKRRPDPIHAPAKSSLGRDI